MFGLQEPVFDTIGYLPFLYRVTANNAVKGHRIFQRARPGVLITHTLPEAPRYVNLKCV